MKKLFVSMLALALTVGAFAQTANKTPPSENKEWKMKGRQDRGNQMKNLNLTEAQKEKMKGLNEGFRQQMQNLKQDNTLSEEAKKQKSMDMMKEHRSQMEAILTPEQKATWKAEKKNGAMGKRDSKKVDKADRKSARTKGKMRRGMDADKMASELKLTTEQTARLKTLQQKMKTDAQQIKANESLTADQKKVQMQDLRKKHKEQMESLLTAEQKQLLKNKHRNRQHDNKDGITK